MLISEVLATKDKWTKDCFANAADGSCIWRPESPKAVCWCLMGAAALCKLKQDVEFYKKMDTCIRKVVDVIPENWLIDDKFSELHGLISPARFNDASDYETVMAAVKEFESL